MARHSYKTALRAKGIRPLPPYHRLRSAVAGGEAIINPLIEQGTRRRAPDAKALAALRSKDTPGA